MSSSKPFIMHSIDLEIKFNSDEKDKITKLSAKYRNYKGFYNFPTKYKGSVNFNSFIAIQSYIQ